MQKLYSRAAQTLGVLLVAGLCLAAAACGSLTNVLNNTTGYSAAEKAQFANVVQPVAVRLAAEILKKDSGNLTTSDDGKSYLVSENISGMSGYSALVTIAKTGSKPNPSQVTSIDLNHYAANGKVDEDINIQNTGDGYYADTYWYVEDAQYAIPGVYTDANTTLSSNLPGGGFDGAISTTRTIIGTVTAKFEPGLLAQN